ncbi:hypothetical protein AHAS_Ahas13G0142200 [Arachis hypogaea]
MLKINRATSIHSRGRFARICVEIDLTKKLIPRISVLGSTLNIEYEGLHLICFICGLYGHRSEDCSENISDDNSHRAEEYSDEGDNLGEKNTLMMMEEINMKSPATMQESQHNQKLPDFAPWMMGNWNPKMVQLSETGSRYNVMYEDGEIDGQDNTIHYVEDNQEAMQCGLVIFNSPKESGLKPQARSSQQKSKAQDERGCKKSSSPRKFIQNAPAPMISIEK